MPVGLGLFLAMLFCLPLKVCGDVPGAPDNLRVCNKKDPVGIGNRPYFGWYVNDPDDNEIQRAYQIIVASSPAKLGAGHGDVWDSGKVSTHMQNYIYYAGSALRAGTRYFWKIRTWDKDGQVGPYSAPAVFETGLFTFSDWSGARWIKRNTAVRDDYTYFRKKTNLPDKTISHAVVYIAACHSYALYVNGKFIGKGFNHHYPQYSYYHAWDITSALVSNADNVFACFTHWYGGGQGRAAGNRGLMLKAVIQYTDGTSAVIGTDATWKQTQVDEWSTDQPQRNGEGIGSIELIDSRKQIARWNKLDYNDAFWQPATEIGTPPVAPWTSNLRPDLRRVIEKEIRPVSVTSPAKGVYVIDLGKVYPGMPHITFNGGTAGDTINMRGGFVLEANGTVSEEINQDTDMRYRFILNGDTAVFHPMDYLGMRYLQVENSPHALTQQNVRFICRHYELDISRSAFSSSSTMLDKVWDLMRHSLIAGAQEGFVDTPTREKGPFLSDGWSQGVAAMSTVGDRIMNLYALREFLDSQDQYWPDGRLNAVYPNADGARDIPDFTQSYLVWVWDYYVYTGDLEFLRNNYTKFKKVADYVDAYTNKTSGLIHNLKGGNGPYQFGIIDWPAQMRYGYDMACESRTVIDAYAYAGFDIISRVADALGMLSDRDKYRHKALAMKNAINAKLINPQGVYVDGLHEDHSQSSHVSQHANMFPMALDIVPDSNFRAVASVIKERKMNVGMVTVRWLPEAIARAGEGEHFIDLYTNTAWDGWAKTVALGGTVTWESWDAHTNNQSMSHPWGAVGLLGIQKYILGLEPISPQHNIIQVKPLDFKQKLRYAKGIVPTDRGDIMIHWSRSDRGFTMTLIIPDNVTARVYVPRYDLKETRLKRNGVTITGTGAGEYILVDHVGSGRHVFESVSARH